MRRARFGIVHAIVALLAMGTTAAAQGRPGIRVQLASLGSEGGMQGRAFLLVSRREVRVQRTGSADCAGQAFFEATGRLHRGPVRQVTVRVFGHAQAGRLPLSGSRCPRADVRVVLRDGSVLTGGDGTLELTKVDLSREGSVIGRFSQTVRHHGVPITVRGSFRIPVS